MSIKDRKAYPYLQEYLLKYKLEFYNRLTQQNSLDLKEFFDISNLDSQDVFNPKIFRSTKKRNKNDGNKEIIEDPELSILEIIESSIINEDGEFIVGLEEFANTISITFEEMDSDFIDTFYKHPFIVSDTYEYALLENDIDFSSMYESISLYDDNRFTKSYEHIVNQPGDELHENENGYYIPLYNVMRSNLDYEEVEKEYKKLSKELEQEGENTLKAASYIGSYRDLLINQLERQLNQLSEINDYVLNLLNISYMVIQKVIEFVQDNDQKATLKTSVINDFYYVLDLMRLIYLHFYMNYNIDEEFLKIIEEQILRIPYLDEEPKTSVIEEIYNLEKKRKPILEIANKLALKATICESILEDLLLGEPKKTFGKFFKSLKVELTRETIIKKTHFKKMNGMKWPQVHEEIKEWLLTVHELDENDVKERFGFGINNLESFIRFINKNNSYK